MTDTERFLDTCGRWLQMQVMLSACGGMQKAGSTLVRNPDLSMALKVKKAVITISYFVARTNKTAESFDVNFSIPEVLGTEHFVGRHEQLIEIHEKLKNDGSRKIVVLHGLGGMGKTQLALTYAKRHINEYSAVFWLNSKDVDTLRQGFVSAAKRILRAHPSLTHLKDVAKGADLDEAVDIVKSWLSHPKNNQWLLIYDNYDTPKLSGHHDSGGFNIQPFLPEGYQGAVIITTRSSQLKIGYLIPVKRLQSIDHSLEILSHTSRRQDLNKGR